MYTHRSSKNANKHTNTTCRRYTLQKFTYIELKNAKRIINELSLLAVLLSAEMILSCHAPSPLPNLLLAKQNALPAAPPPAVADSAAEQRTTATSSEVK